MLLLYIVYVQCHLGANNIAGQFKTTAPRALTAISQSKQQ